MNERKDTAEEIKERVLRHILEHPEVLDTLMERLLSDEAEDWPNETER